MGISAPEAKNKMLGLLSLDDIPGEYRAACEIIGLEKALALARVFGGISLYVPKIEKLLRHIKYRLIRQEFNGRNHRQLAAKYGYSVKWVQMIVGGKV